MPPRKRRSRAQVSNPSSSAPTPDSASNSLATSSPSSHRNSNSRSDSPDLDLIHAPSHSTPPPPRPRPHPTPPPDIRSVISAASSLADSSVAHADPAAAFTVASVALRLYDQLIDWAVLQFAVQYKHHVYLISEDRRRAAIFPSPAGQRAAPRISIIPGSHGSSLLFTEKNVTVECSNCNATVAAARYAQHLEKCLGRGGRVSSRNAAARLRASAERPDKDLLMDQDDPPTRRRRHSASAAAKTAASKSAVSKTSATAMDHDSLSSAAPPSHAAHKRRRMSPIAAPPGSSVPHSSLHSRNLPPSGRTRASPK